MLIVQGICAFSGSQMSKKFLARRGSASRPARPRRLTAGAARKCYTEKKPDSLKIGKIGKTNLGHQNGLTQGSVKILDPMVHPNES